MQTPAAQIAERKFMFKVPPAFVTDCIECCCDVGDYDNGFLTCTQDQLDEFISRARHYADPYAIDCSFGLRRSALASLKAVGVLA